MKRQVGALMAFAAVASLGAAGAHAQQYPVMEQVAQKVIQKYQTASCAQLAAKRHEPPGAMEAKVIQLMRDDAAMRAAFIDRVAAPIANKLFECHLLP